MPSRQRQTGEHYTNGTDTRARPRTDTRACLRKDTGAMSDLVTPDETDSADVESTDGEQRDAEYEAYLQNGGPKWEARLKQKDQAIAEEKSALAAERAAVAEERKALAMERQQPPTTEEREVPEEAISLDLSNMPNPLDDQELYTAELQRRIDQRDARRDAAMEARMEARLAKALEAQGSSTSETVQKAVSKVELESARKDAFAHNRQTLKEYFSEHPEITPAEHGRIAKRADKFLRDDDYGTVDPTSNVFLFNKDAVEAADRLERRKYYEAQVREMGVEEGLKLRNRAPGGKPAASVGKNASPEEIWTAAQKVKDSPRAMEAFMDGLSSGQVDALIQYSNELDLAAMGE